MGFCAYHVLCVKNHDVIANTVEVVSVLEAHECSAWKIQKLLSEEVKAEAVKEVAKEAKEAKEAKALGEPLRKALAEIKIRSSMTCCAGHKPNRYTIAANGSVRSHCDSSYCTGKTA